MITCIKCGGFISHDWSNLSSICGDCAVKIVGDAPPRDLLVLAKIGIDALIDEATEYQEVRPKNDLAKRYENYKEGE